MSDPASSSALGPALFIGLSVFVAVSQGAPEIEFANPAETYVLDDLTRAPDLAGFAVPQALARPLIVTFTTTLATLTAPVPAVAEDAPTLTTASFARPGLPAPGLTGVPAPQAAPTPPQSGTPADIQAATPTLGQAASVLAPTTLAQGPAARPQLTGPNAPEVASAIPAPTAPQTVLQTRAAALARPDVSATNQLIVAPQPAQPLQTRAQGTAQPQVTNVERLPAQPLPGPLNARSLTVSTPVGIAEQDRLSHLANVRPDQAPLPVQAPLRIVTGDRVFLRDGPDLSAATLAQFDRGAQALVLSRWRSWSRVRVLEANGWRDGWMWSAYLAPVSGTDGQSQP